MCPLESGHPRQRWWARELGGRECMVPRGVSDTVGAGLSPAETVRDGTECTLGEGKPGHRWHLLPRLCASHLRPPPPPLPYRRHKVLWAIGEVCQTDCLRGNVTVGRGPSGREKAVKPGGKGFQETQWHGGHLSGCGRQWLRSVLAKSLTTKTRVGPPARQGPEERGCWERAAHQG